MSDKKLRSATYIDVRTICEDVGKHLDVEFDQNSTDLIGELVWKKMISYAQDLEAFAKHGKRVSINTEDVRLLCRRNKSLVDFIEKECPTAKVVSAGPSRMKRKRKASIVIDNIIDD